jgi:serine phosphatase RsbU (regulator of sigma subunit)
MTRRRILTLSIAFAGAILALVFFQSAYEHELARHLYDAALFGAAIALIRRIRPARSIRGEILRLSFGILIHILTIVAFSSIVIATNLADFPSRAPSWLLLTHVPLALNIAWSMMSIIRLGGFSNWGKRRRAVLIYAVFVIVLLLAGAPQPLLVILAIAFVLFVLPWPWVELLSSRDGWYILLLFVLAPLGFMLFMSGISSNEADGLIVSVAMASVEPLLSSKLLDWLGDIVAFTWFVVPIKLTVALFQGLFGIRIPIWLKFSTTYIFSTIIPGLLLLLLVILGVYMGIGSLRAQLVRDMIHQDLQDLELALVESRLQGYAEIDSVSSATYRRVFPSATDRGKVPPPPNPFGTGGSGFDADPYDTPEANLPESWQMYARVDSLLGEMGPLELWIKVNDDHGLWELPDTLSPFPGWYFTESARHGILPMTQEKAAFAAAYVRPGNPGQIQIVMRPLNRETLEPYKRTVRSDITLHPYEILHLGSSGDDFNIDVSDDVESSNKDIEISTIPDSSNSLWQQHIIHGFSELQSWPGSNNSSTYVGTIVLNTSLESLFTTLYSWEGANRLVIIGLLALAGLFGLAVLFSTLLAGGITRTIVRSVRELRLGTERLRKGDLEVQIQPGSNDELGDLALSFNEMTSDLRRMISEVTVKERLEREIQIARRIQIHLLPTELPQRPTLRVGAHSDPAFEVGGDYYDCIDLGDRGLLVVLGDVSGKGVGAAVLMSNLQASLSLLATHNLPLHELVRQLNVQVCKNSTPEMFITFFAALFDPIREVMTYVNAGHDVPFLIRRGKPINLEMGGMLLGIMDDAEYASNEIDVQPGDLFASYSDGLTEAMNETDVEFGRDRLIETMDEYKHLDPHLLVTKVLQTIRDYAGHERAGRDDLTLITVKVIES